MDAKATKGRRQARRWAERKEVMNAVTSGHLVGLLQKRRVSLAIAEDVLVEARTFLAGTSDPIAAAEKIPDTDIRIAPLVRHIKAEKAKGVITAKGRGRAPNARVGQTARYKALTTGGRSEFLHLPLATLKKLGIEMKNADVTFFDADHIIVTRAGFAPKLVIKKDES